MPIQFSRLPDFREGLSVFLEKHAPTFSAKLSTDMGGRLPEQRFEYQLAFIHANIRIISKRAMQA